MPRIVEVANRQDIPPAISGGPVGLLLEYHNLHRPFDQHEGAQLLVGMCMDNRKHLRMPDNFAFVIRAGGANLKPSEFKVSYAIAIGGVRALALITHTQCGMVNLEERRDRFIDGLVEGAGWDRPSAEEHFSKCAPVFEIGHDIAFAATEAARLSRTYPRIQVVPLLYKVEDNLLYLIERD
jgi:carbonic anhydrase